MTHHAIVFVLSSSALHHYAITIIYEPADSMQVSQAVNSSHQFFPLLHIHFELVILQAKSSTTPLHNEHHSK